MKNLLLFLFFLCATISFAQVVEEEFIPIKIEEKEAFMSTKTGEYVFKAHADTNPKHLLTTPSGVVYTDITYHNVEKGETLSSISKKYNLEVDQLKTDNNLTDNALSLGQKIKLVNRFLVTSSSPVISYAGEERIVARLPVGESPATLPPPPMPTQVAKPVKQAPKQSSYSKPMVIPQATSNTIEEEVIVNEDDTDEIIAAKHQLEAAKKQLELAKIKANKKKDAIEDNTLVIEDVVEDNKEEILKEEIEDVEEVIEDKHTKANVDVAKPTINTDASENKTSAKTPEYHVIVKGDNLYKLSKKYKVSVEELIKINNVNFKNLKIGQKLKLK